MAALIVAFAGTASAEMNIVPVNAEGIFVTGSGDIHADELTPIR